MKPLRIIAPLVIATGLPLVGAGVASATPLSITSCSITPATVSLAPGESVNVSLGWEDGVNRPGAQSSVFFQEMSLNGVKGMGNVQAMGTSGTNPLTVPFGFDALSSMLGAQAGTVKFSLYATDGSAKVGSELCSFTASVAAVGSTTSTTVVPTTVVPTTLPQTGSNTATMLAGGAMIAAFGGALYLTGRRRSVK